MKEKKARVEDAMHATKAAVEEGIVPGGGVALLRCQKVVEGLKVEGDLKVGVETVRDPGCASCVAFVASGGPGLAAAGFGGALHAALFADGSVEAAPDLRGIGGSGWRLGLGPSALLRLSAGSRGALLASGDWRWLPGTPTHQTWAVSGAARVHLGQRTSLAIEYRRRPSEQSLGLTLYLFDAL
jgi:hypothetical protein